MHMVLAVVCLMREGEKDIGQFTPVHWDKDEWHPLQAAWHVIQPELKPCNLIMSLMNLQGTFYVSYETRSEYQKEIEEPYMGNVEKERKVANNSKPNSGNKGMKIVMHEVLSVHGHIFSSEKQPGSLLE
ncbi:hypothetical protein Bca52824_042488 [Brassica carinata]|uniref:Uncharacterized protein n=1 Tax=Brassica carinata TaxID=52824 RepID=A0A8X7RVC7_BRACI|nr:hypothetical protein Bca52824_042488 [Brassica carinata]